MDSVHEDLQHLENLCLSDALTLDSLQKQIGRVYRSLQYRTGTPYLHLICMNDRVTLEIVQYMLHNFPETAKEKISTPPTHRVINGVMVAVSNQWGGCCLDGALPLHIACKNKDCPDEAVQLMMEKYPGALRHMCQVNDGAVCYSYNMNSASYDFPLNYYLSRTENMNLSTVQLLVNTWPQVLIQDVGYTLPIHVIAGHPNVSHLQHVLEYILGYAPTSIRMEDDYSRTPMNLACSNPYVNVDIVQLLLNAWPEATRRPDMIDNSTGDQPQPSRCLPIHNICRNVLDDTTSRDILRLLIDADPLSLGEKDGDTGSIPLHYAVKDRAEMDRLRHHTAPSRSVEFCRMLVEAYPESLTIATEKGCDSRLPIHDACMHGTVDIVEYLLHMAPDSINSRSIIRDEQDVIDDDNTRNRCGSLPIHRAAEGGKADIIKLLLKHDPHAAEKKTSVKHRLPLHYACKKMDFDSVKILYDVYPEALLSCDEDGHKPYDLARRSGNSEVYQFLRTQFAYAQRAQDTVAMSTPDAHGHLPLIYALCLKDASLGSIKLLLKGNPDALQTATPVYIACRNVTADIVQFLIESSRLDVCDTNKDYPLHHACRVANLDVIKYLVKSNTPAVSETNNDNKLPFHLLVESDMEQLNRESSEYTEACFLLLRAHPETVTMKMTRKRRRE